MPAHTAPHKSPARDPGAWHRLQMCRLLLADTPGVSACALELERGGTSYTVDTLKAIHASHPEVGLTLIVGADTAITLPSWHEPLELLELADLAVAERPGTTRGEVLDQLAALQRKPSRARRQEHAVVGFLEMPVMVVSSSAARRRVQRGQPVDALVGSAVARYIAEHGLYRHARERPRGRREAAH